MGSGVGGLFRYAISILMQPEGVAFPIGTLLVNVAGCLLLGVFVELAPTRFSDATRLLLTTGFCGGFTTFSTFSYESIRLMQSGLWARAVSYVGSSVVLGLAAIWIGFTMAKGFAGTVVH